MFLSPLALGTGLYPADNCRVCAVRTQFPGALLDFDFVLRFIWLTIVPNCSCRSEDVLTACAPDSCSYATQYKKTTPAAIHSVNEIRSRFFSQSEKEWRLGLKTLPGIPRTPSQYWPCSRAFSYTSHFLREKALGSRLSIYRTQKRVLYTQGQCSLSPNWLSHVFAAVTRRGESVLSGS